MEARRIAVVREEIDDFKGHVREGMFASIIINAVAALEHLPAGARLIEINTNDYDFGAGEFDAEKWEDHNSYVYTLPDKEHWKLAYRIARILVRGKTVRIEETGVLLTPPVLVEIWLKEAEKVKGKEQT